MSRHEGRAPVPGIKTPRTPLVGLLHQNKGPDGKLQPLANERRQRKMALRRALGLKSGRQWVKARKAAQRVPQAPGGAPWRPDP